MDHCHDIITIYYALLRHQVTAIESYCGCHIKFGPQYNT